MKLSRLAGSTSQIWEIFIRDTSSSTGGGLTGLVYNSASLTAYYHRNTGTTATAISLVTMTVGTFTSGGFKEIDATNMPGWYQFCPPDAAIASGATSCSFHLKGATNMCPVPIEVDLSSDVNITTTIAQKIAHIILRRTMTNAEASSDGDTLNISSLYGMIQQIQESNTTANTGKLTVFKVDGTTELSQLTLATNASAEPIIGIS